MKGRSQSIRDGQGRSCGRGAHLLQGRVKPGIIPAADEPSERPRVLFGGTSVNCIWILVASLRSLATGTRLSRAGRRTGRIVSFLSNLAFPFGFPLSFFPCFLLSLLPSLPAGRWDL